MSTLKVNEVRHISNTGTANIVLESNENTNLQTTSTKGLSVDGTLTVTGVATLNGNTVVGNASTDTMSLTSTVTGFNNFSGFTGEMRMYAGNAAGNAPPTGWLYCNGDTISQTTGNGGTHYNADGKSNDYQALFNLLKASNDWGNASSAAWGTNTVKVPDFRSRSPVGVGTGAANAIGTGSDSAALSVRTLGDTTGAENHILVTNEIPAHLHGATSVTATTGVTASLAAITATQAAHSHTMAHTHAIDPPSTTSGAISNGITDPGHTHILETVQSWGSSTHYRPEWGPGPTLVEPATNSATTGISHPHTHAVDIASFTSGGVSTANTGNATPAITLNSPATTIADSGHSHTVTTTNTGGGLKHQNLSPIIAVNFIIKV
jgi:microcystin-dependent protein